MCRASLCKECIDFHWRPSIFCSPECADGNYRRHREEVHQPLRERVGIDIDDEGKLEHWGGDESRDYHAVDIYEDVVLLKDAVREFEEKNHVKGLSVGRG